MTFDDLTDITTDRTPAEVLRDAARYVSVYGWYRHGLFGSTVMALPSACVLGAIQYAATGKAVLLDTYTDLDADVVRLYFTTVSVLATYLVESGPLFFEFRLDMPFNLVLDWNDEKGRTADQVVSALKGAARYWERVYLGGAR